MSFEIFLIFAISFFCALVGLLVIVLMIRGRAPHEGIRHWVKQARNTKIDWKSRPFTTGRPGTLREEDFVTVKDSTMSALNDVENLQQEASKLKSQLVEKHKKKTGGSSVESAKPVLPPVITTRPKGKKWKAVQEKLDSEKSEKLEPENLGK